MKQLLIDNQKNNIFYYSKYCYENYKGLPVNLGELEKKML